MTNHRCAAAPDGRPMSPASNALVSAGKGQVEVGVNDHSNCNDNVLSGESREAFLALVDGLGSDLTHKAVPNSRS